MIGDEKSKAEKCAIRLDLFELLGDEKYLPECGDCEALEECASRGNAGSPEGGLSQARTPAAGSILGA